MPPQVPPRLHGNFLASAPKHDDMLNTLRVPHGFVDDGFEPYDFSATISSISSYDDLCLAVIDSLRERF